MKTPIVLIAVHSMVDLITNSSSEIFVAANDKTVKTIQQIVDHLLALGGSEKKAKDLFRIELASAYDTEDYEMVYLTDKELKAALKDGTVKFNMDHLDEGEELEAGWKPDPREGTENSYIKVTALDDSRETEKIAKLLNSLQDLFSGEDISNY
jgi:hypothetical protein